MKEVKYMNIAIIGKFFTEGVAVHIDETLRDMGHETVRIDPEIKFLQSELFSIKFRSFTKTIYQQVLFKIPFIRNKSSKKIFSYYNNNNIDLTIVTHDFLTKQEIEEIKKINQSPIVIWFPDAISNFQKSMFFVAGYDFLFFKDKYVVDKLKNEYLLNAFYLPQCCNPKQHNKVTLTKEEEDFYGCEITNAGNLYPSRAALYKNLLQYNFKVWGGQPAIWLKMPELDKIIMGKAVFNQEKAKAFTAAKIVLNNMHLAEINGLNKRAFEIPACGGFQIISYNDAVNELFEIGKEIVIYKNLNDLKNKIDYYLNPINETERLQIIEAGYQRAIKDHTYNNRLETMFSLIFN